MTLSAFPHQHAGASPQHMHVERGRIGRHALPATIILSTLFVTHYCPIPSFRPIQLLYGGQVAPLFLSPFTLPTNITLAPVISRALQLAILLLHYRGKAPQWSFAELYTAHLSVAALRTAFAFVFNRAVGWTFPSLFIHSAGYECISGLGPAILVLSLRSPSLGSSANGFMAELLVIVACVLDRAPWSYACALLAGLCWRLASFLCLWGSSTETRDSYQYELELPVSIENPVSWPYTSSLPSISCSTFLRTLIITGARFSLALSIAAAIVASTAPRPHTDLPWPSASLTDTERPRPLLNIIVLSSPRPDSSSNLLEMTLESYLPLLRGEADPKGDENDSGSERGPVITLTAYTRSEPRDHPAFKHASESDKFKFGLSKERSTRASWPNVDRARDEDAKRKDSSPAGIRFVYDTRVQGEPADLYGDASGLLNFAYSGMLANQTGVHSTINMLPEPAEWTMLVEDDFPLCPGPQGGDAILAVLSALERRRLRLPRLSRYAAGLYELQDDTDEENWPRGGWVGTGGSGLIFHRSILRAAAHLLRTPAPLPSTSESNSENPDSDHNEEEDLRSPPDLIMQSCVLSKASSTGTGAEAVGCGDGGAVISARLAMRHAGSGNSALQHETPSDKWQCGWRHPAHGRPEIVQVIDL